MDVASGGHKSLKEISMATWRIVRARKLGLWRRGALIRTGTVRTFTDYNKKKSMNIQKYNANEEYYFRSYGYIASSPGHSRFHVFNITRRKCGSGLGTRLIIIVSVLTWRAQRMHSATGSEGSRLVRTVIVVPCAQTRVAIRSIETCILKRTARSAT